MTTSNASENSIRCQYCQLIEAQCGQTADPHGFTSNLFFS